MRTLFPMPWLSLAVFLAWPMLSGGISPASLIGGVLFALLLPWLTRRFVPQVAHAGKPATIARLVWVVFNDIILSNITVARQVLGDVNKLNSRFVDVPVDTEHPYVLTLLACIITMTPGTLSARVDEPLDGQPPCIVVHALHCDDPESLVRDIKTRYETPLMEIFGCSPLR
ncbi:MAG: Na+/H+ antiporter subunit E [Burkholderiaceae bacterium]